MHTCSVAMHVCVRARAYVGMLVSTASFIHPQTSTHRQTRVGTHPQTHTHTTSGWLLSVVICAKFTKSPVQTSAHGHVNAVCMCMHGLMQCACTCMCQCECACTCMHVTLVHQSVSWASVYIHARGVGPKTCECSAHVHACANAITPHTFTVAEFSPDL